MAVVDTEVEFAIPAGIVIETVELLLPVTLKKKLPDHIDNRMVLLAPVPLEYIATLQVLPKDQVLLEACSAPVEIRPKRFRR